MVKRGQVFVVAGGAGRGRVRNDFLTCTVKHGGKKT